MAHTSATDGALFPVGLVVVLFLLGFGARDIVDVWVDFDFDIIFPDVAGIVWSDCNVRIIDCVDINDLVGPRSDVILVFVLIDGK
jgi:hypothetical protein